MKMKNSGTVSYRNGNTLVAICADGTKFRYTPDYESPTPNYPESTDLKITEYCEEGCPMCHENAGIKGRHADLNHPLLDSIPSYTELAIGGGNPMAHPDLYGFLQKMREHRVICNLTVHYNEFMKSFNTLLGWQKDGLIHGVGVSVNHQLADIYTLEVFPHLVVHTIAGVTDEETYRSIAERDLKILILGYKDRGRGIQYHKQNKNVERKIRWLADHILSFPDYFRSISFDDLAIRQLDIRKKITETAWNHLYMGRDGQYSMYVNLVRGEYAASSVSERKAIFSDDIRDLFASLKNNGSDKKS